jgi:hypothetical protein
MCIQYSLYQGIAVKKRVGIMELEVSSAEESMNGQDSEEIKVIF